MSPIINIDLKIRYAILIATNLKAINQVCDRKKNISFSIQFY